ncbi:PR-1-like protein [Dacryopinax primogenitus]|uniref:PR-1-like protein n=1 Tax=Dacryopinax primogenitus (strain DJM 731) TaxID=1858805 RepID=M5FNS0_DACPD|nr:PR-1-like protein [Dacryopinax primogenitus]EJT97855.1 PR-1-like protein [Dacryopinax primogenitus]
MQALLLLLLVLPALARPAKSKKGKKGRRCRPRSSAPSPTSEAVTTITSSQDTQPTPAPANVAPSPSDNGNNGSGNGSSADELAYLCPQNAARAQFNASPLTWNNTLASAAQEWANKCVFQHSMGTLGPYGENLAAGSGDFTPGQGIQLWLDEASQYDPSNPVPSHWTQVVWQGSTEVGCAVSVCPGLLGASFGNANFYVCEYFPQGNIIGAFAQNVA